MRLLTGVSSNMDVQCTALDKGLVAPRFLALERPRFRVNAVVSLQVGFAVEGLATLGPIAGPGARGRLCVHDF